MNGLYGTDAYSPDEIAEQIEEVGVKKANLPLAKMGALGVLAGAFISLGAMFFTLVISDAELGFAIARVLGGLAFSLGLILVVIAARNSSPATTSSSWLGCSGGSRPACCSGTSSWSTSRTSSAASGSRG
jgi:formate/nitrite transporter FocA (FNT family)